MYLPRSHGQNKGKIIIKIENKKKDSHLFVNSHFVLRICK